MIFLRRIVEENGMSDALEPGFALLGCFIKLAIIGAIILIIVAFFLGGLIL